MPSSFIRTLTTFFLRANMHHEADILTIKACQQGDFERFAELYERYVRSIYDFIYYKTYHRETAEDLTSHTFTKALEHIATFDLKKGKFSAWLFRIARNTVIDHYRIARPTQELSDAFDIAGNEDVKAHVHARVRLEKVREFLKKLPPDTREIIILRVWQDLPFADIAAINGKTEASVKMAFSRAVKQLRTEDLLLALFILIYRTKL